MIKVRFLFAVMILVVLEKTVYIALWETNIVVAQSSILYIVGFYLKISLRFLA